MRGDAPDFVSRLRLTLPAGWFADDAPLLDGLFAGLGASWTGLYELLRQVRLQSRIATATGQFVDMACTDFFGLRVRRRGSETDDALRARVARAMRRERATRTALIEAAAEAGYAARVFEVSRPADTGAYNVAAGLAWGVAGGWGSLAMPLECLVTVTAVAPTEAIGPVLAATMPAGGVAWVREA